MPGFMLDDKQTRFHLMRNRKVARCALLLRRLPVTYEVNEEKVI